MTLDKSQFGFMAIKGIQELSKENDSLKNVIESQTQKINQLEETIKQHTILLAQLMTK
jgi:peptidoglycan hydrolase CwlO-like protein